MNILKLLLIAMTVVTLNAGDFIVKKSNYSVSDTVLKLETIIKAKGMNHFATINHQEGAKKVGLTMNEAQVIIFGNPKIGTKLMNIDIKAALDLPLKILVYNDNKGQTKIEYLNPLKLNNRFALKDAKVLLKMKKALNKITNKAIK